MFGRKGDDEGKNFGGSGFVERMHCHYLLDAGVFGGIWSVLLDPVRDLFLGREGEEGSVAFEEAVLRWNLWLMLILMMWALVYRGPAIYGENFSFIQ